MFGLEVRWIMNFQTSWKSVKTLITIKKFKVILSLIKLTRTNNKFQVLHSPQLKCNLIIHTRMHLYSSLYYDTLFRTQNSLESCKLFHHFIHKNQIIYECITCHNNLNNHLSLENMNESHFNKFFWAGVLQVAFMSEFIISN